jgi:hypothetical protein
MGSVRIVRKAGLLMFVGALSVLALPTVASAAGTTVSTNPGGAVPCAVLKLRATPPVNAQNAPYETIKNTVTSCSSATETVTLTQTISGPFAPANAPSRTWVLTLAPGQTITKVQHIPYSCCGTYTVRDRVTAGPLLLARKSAMFTFA